MSSRIPIKHIEDARTVAWLAALLEGEGSFVLTGNRIAISLSMTDKDVVDKVCALTGARCHASAKREAHHKQAYSCKITGIRAKYYMELVMPYMGVRRSEKIRHCIAHFDTEASDRREKTAALGRVISDGQLRAAWLGKNPSQSFREFVKELGLQARGSTKRRLVNLGLLQGEQLLPSPIERVGNSFNTEHIASLEAATAWLAGLLEGEGSFTWSNDAAGVHLKMADEDVVARFCELTGSTYYYTAPALEHYKNIFSVVITGFRAIELMTRILPNMGIRRSARIGQVIKLFRKFQVEKEQRRLARVAHLRIEEMKARWETRQPSESLLRISKEFGLHPESLKKQLVKLGVYAAPVYKSRTLTTSVCAKCGGNFEHQADVARTYCSALCAGNGHRSLRKDSAALRAALSNGAKAP